MSRFRTIQKTVHMVQIPMDKRGRTDLAGNQVVEEPVSLELARFIELLEEEVHRVRFELQNQALEHDGYEEQVAILKTDLSHYKRENKTLIEHADGLADEITEAASIERARHDGDSFDAGLM